MPAGSSTSMALLHASPVMLGGCQPEMPSSTAGGTVRVIVERQGGWASIAVVDEGIGISSAFGRDQRLSCTATGEEAVLGCRKWGERPLAGCSRYSAHRPRRDQVLYHRRPAGLLIRQCLLLHRLIRHRRPFMLPQVLGPRCHLVGLDKALGLGRIAKEFPAEGPIAQPDQPHLLHRRDEVFFRTVANAILDAHLYRPILRRRIDHRLRRGDVLRGTEVQFLAGAEPPA